MTMCHSSSYNVSVNGGSEKVKYFFNLGYLKQEGAYKFNSLNYDRWNFRSNVECENHQPFEGRLYN